MKVRLLGMAAAAAVIGCVEASPTMAATNIVQNPGFETGDLTDWTGHGWQIFSGSEGIAPNEGNYYAGAPCTSDDPRDLSQSLATTTGETYTLSFAFNPGYDVVTDVDGGADTKVYWNGSEVADIGLDRLAGPFTPSMI
jgi:hypothetical protein